MVISERHFQQFIKGDEKSFESIFCQYYKTLVSYAMRHDLELMEAEDVVLEIFHHIWQIREELKSPAALHSLLFTATKNRTLNVARNLKNRQKLISENFPVKEEEESQDYLMEEEMSHLLNEAINQLPKQCEQVIIGLLEGIQSKGDSILTFLIERYPVLTVNHFNTKYRNRLIDKNSKKIHFLSPK